MRKVCVVTGSRAEYGLLSGLMREIEAEETLQLQVIATNMHLSPEFGLTYKEIESDGFRIDRKVEMLLSSDTPNGTAKSVGLATIGFADAYETLKPDIIVLLGDRYEIIAAASAALFYKIPVAHLHGGEITEGAYDDALRHAITKMSHLHFTSTEAYRKRVIQLGECPERVFYVGGLGVENIKKISLLSKEELEKEISMSLGDQSFLITYHPVTLEHSTAEEQCRHLLDALEEYPDYNLIFTLPNSDTDGRVIIRLINDFVKKHPNRSVVFPSLGLRRYLSALKYVNAVLGNSSSGILEVPSFGIPTLNIGDRQKGRLAAASVIHCGVTTAEISRGIKTVVSESVKQVARSVKNPYEKSATARQIVEVLRSFPLQNLVRKSFYDL